MDVWALTVAALRRWYVLLPALLLTGLLVSSAGRSVAPEYETTAAALLVPPAVVSDKLNPYAATSGPEVLRTIVNGSAVRGRFAAKGLAADYELDVTAKTPIFTVVVRSDDRERTLATGAAVIDALRGELAKGQRQFNVPVESRMTVQIIDAPDSLTAVGNGRTRVQAVIAVLGLIVSVVLAVTFDDLLLLLRRRRSGSTVPDQVRTELPAGTVSRSAS